MTTKNLTLTEAQTSGEFGLMPRQRLRTVQRELYDQLDQIEFLATQRQPEKSEAWYGKSRSRCHYCRRVPSSGIKLTADDPVIAILLVQESRLKALFEEQRNRTREDFDGITSEIEEPLKTAVQIAEDL